MSDYETEEQQVEAIKEWWKQNGMSVLLGVALGVGAILSWNGWNAYEASNAMKASDLYTEISEAVKADNTEAVSSIATTLRDDYSDSSFASMASLMEAKINAESNQLTDAVSHLQWVIDNSDFQELKTVAAIRKARVLLADGKVSDALASLPEAATGGFSGLIAEVRGDIYIALGDTDKARESYLEAQVNGGSQASPALLGMKLDNLATEEQDAQIGNEDES